MVNGSSFLLSQLHLLAKIMLVETTATITIVIHQSASRTDMPHSVVMAQSTAKTAMVGSDAEPDGRDSSDESLSYWRRRVKKWLQ